METTVYTITPGTPETAEYDPSRFVAMGPDPDPVIYSWAPAFGWIKRPDINPEKLARHLENMRREGFNVETIRI